MEQRTVKQNSVKYCSLSLLTTHRILPGEWPVVFSLYCLYWLHLMYYFDSLRSGISRHEWRSEPHEYLLAAVKPNLCHETLCQKIFCLFSSNGFVRLYFCNCFPITFVQVATVLSKLRTALDAASFWPKFVSSAFLGNHPSKVILRYSLALLPQLPIHFLL